MSAADPGIEESEFKLVVPRKGKQRPRLNSKLQTSFNLSRSENEVCKKKLTTQLQSAESELLQSTFFVECFEKFHPILAGVEQIICLGLGKFSECSIARYQLAFIRCLRNEGSLDEKVKFYDPVFSCSEVDILRTVLSETVLQENVEGKYSAEQKTLFYLPHCPKQIVNNLLWKNWKPSHLPNVILLCNSFASIINNNPHRLLENSAVYIIRAAGVFQEVPLQNRFRFTDIFNDTSLHYLPNGQQLEDGSWDSTEEPSYDDEDLELITKEISNL